MKRASIGLALLSRQWRQHWIALLLIVVGVSTFEFVITRIAPAWGEPGFFDGLLALLPEDVRGMAYDQFQLGYPIGAIAFGYVHPFFLALCSAWVVRIGAGSLAGEVGRGTMDVMASRPVPRWALVAAAAVSIAAGLAVITGAAFAASAFGIRIRPDLQLTVESIWRMPFIAWLFFMAWTGVTLAISAVRRDAGNAIAWASGLIVTSFVIEFLGRVWKPIAWAGPFSLFAYYHPHSSETWGAGIPKSMALGIEPVVLGTVAVAGIALAVVLFQKRDL